MRRSGHFSLPAALVLVPLAAFAQQGLTRAGDRWEQVFSGKAQISPQLRVQGRGPVTLEAGTAPHLEYSAKVSVRAPNEAAARRLLAGYAIRVLAEGPWSVLAVPPGPGITSLMVKTPRLAAAAVWTSDGTVTATGVDGPVQIDSGAGPLTVDRISGDARLVTRGGDIHAGSVGGVLHATTGAGRIAVRSVNGQAVLRTMGGDITANHVGGPLSAETGAGTVRVENAGASAALSTGGGQIWVGHAKGMVTARNMAGPVHIGSAMGVSCNSGAGGISLGAVSGTVQVATGMGNITTVLTHPADSYLVTRNGDITVTIPSNVGVTIQAENSLADSLRRIASDYPQLQVRRRGTRLVAEGQVNGGGPLLRVSAGVGTIFIKRQ